MSANESHRLVRVRKGFGQCSCGKTYSEGVLYGSTEGIREAHKDHKLDVKAAELGWSVETLKAHNARLAGALDQTAMAAHDKRTWELYTDASNAGGRRAVAEASLAKMEASARSEKASERLSVSESGLASMRKRVSEEQLREVAAVAALNSHEESYTGWARFWCVPNGHIHSSRNCSTCYPTTQFYLAHEVSGMDEAAAVAAQGPALCTVCFPSAPVEWTAGQFTSPERQAREAEKAAKAEAKAASEVVVENYTDGGFGRARTHTFKTVRGATNAIASALSSLVWYGPTHPSAPQWLSDIAEVRKALAAKGVEYDYNKALAAARKKAIKDGGVAKY